MKQLKLCYPNIYSGIRNNGSDKTHLQCPKMEIALDFQVRNNDILKLHKMKQKVGFNEEFANMKVWYNWSNSFTSNKLLSVKHSNCSATLLQ